MKTSVVEKVVDLEYMYTISVSVASQRRENSSAPEQDWACQIFSRASERFIGGTAKSDTVSSFSKEDINCHRIK